MTTFEEDLHRLEATWVGMAIEVDLDPSCSYAFSVGSVTFEVDRGGQNMPYRISKDGTPMMASVLLTDAISHAAFVSELGAKEYLGRLLEEINAASGAT